MQAQARYNQFDNEIKEQIILTENSPVHISKLTQNEAIRLLTERKTIVKRNNSNNAPTIINLIRGKSLTGGANPSFNIKNYFNNEISKSKKVMNVYTMANIKQP